MTGDVMILLEEFAAAHARGESPDPKTYIARAGTGAPELAGLLDRYLRSAPAVEPDAETLAMVEGWLAGEPTLVRERARRGVRVRQVVDAILDRFALGADRREQVTGYYQRLEGGTLSPAGVDDGVFAAIAAALGVAVSHLTVWAGAGSSEPGPVAAPSMREAPDVLDASVRADHPPAGETREKREPDEVDRLFGVDG